MDDKVAEEISLADLLGVLVDKHSQGQVHLAVADESRNKNGGINEAACQIMADGGGGTKRFSLSIRRSLELASGIKASSSSSESTNFTLNTKGALRAQKCQAKNLFFEVEGFSLRLNASRFWNVGH